MSGESKYCTLITGGASGIGQECVKLLASKISNSFHNKIIFTYRSNKNQANILMDDLKRQYPNCDIESFFLDLCDQDSIKNLVQVFKEKKYIFNSIVHNAGVGTATIKEQLLNSTNNDNHEDENLAFLKINAMAPLALQEAMDPLLAEEEPGTAIVFIGSVGGGDRPVLESSVGDTSSKAYLDFRVKDFAARNLQTHRHIIRLNLGATDTNMFQKSTLSKMDKETRHRFEANMPKGRVFSPQLVASAVVYHADPKHAALYHGTSISLSGGLHLYYASLMKD